MKTTVKHLMRAVAMTFFAGLVLVSCSGDPYERLLDKMDDYIEKIEKADVDKMSKEDAKDFVAELGKLEAEANQLREEIQLEGVRPTPEQEKRTRDMASKVFELSGKLMKLNAKITDL